MSLIKIDLPAPMQLRAGWAALAAVHAAHGWTDLVCAGDNTWLYHDGGGNWVCLRFIGKDQAILFGQDHEYSNTFFGEACAYFGEEETDLLAGAPAWWGADLSTPPCGEWIAFIYGWDGQIWQRADYAADDGFDSIDLLDGCSMIDCNSLTEFVADAPGHHGQAPDPQAIRALIAADANITPALLERVVPGWDIAAGVAAARKFLEIQ